MKRVAIIIGSFFALPVFLIIAAARSNLSAGKKAWYIILILIMIGSTWGQAYYELYIRGYSKLYAMGVIDTLSNVHVSGTSMLPTIQDGTTIALHNPNKYSISYGDVVSFKNIETGNMNYIKRIIGMPGDTVVIKNGGVSLNGQVLNEPYTYNQQPTYGNTFLLECRVYTVPPDAYLVLGDNRTVSQDSRVVGFIGKKNIGGIIKKDLMPEFQSGTAAKQVTPPAAAAIVERINSARIAKEQLPFVPNPKLDEIAVKRAEYVKNNPEDWKMQEDINQFLTGQKYGFNLAHEYVTFGYLTNQQVFDQLSESVVDNAYMLSPKFYEIGVGITNVTNQSCSYPVIVIIFSWPSNPTYSEAVINSWKKDADMISDIMTKMQSYVGAPGLNQARLKTIISKLSEASEIANRVYARMQANEWLTDKDNQDIERYPALSDEVEALIKTEFSAGLPAAPASAQTQSSAATSAPGAPTPTPANTKFTSAGQTTIEQGATVTINSASVTGGKVVIHITFANPTSSAKTVNPFRVSMNSLTHGMGPSPAYTGMSLNSQEIRSFDLSYEMLQNPPFTFKYLNTSGDSVSLGTYTP